MSSPAFVASHSRGKKWIEMFCLQYCYADVAFFSSSYELNKENQEQTIGHLWLYSYCWGRAETYNYVYSCLLFYCLPQRSKLSIFSFYLIGDT